jgi:hypothetical protein
MSGYFGRISMKASERMALALILIHTATASLLMNHPTHVVEICADILSWLINMGLAAFLLLTALFGSKAKPTVEQGE